jgi:hypothetical protein
VLRYKQKYANLTPCRGRRGRNTTPSLLIDEEKNIKKNCP